MQFEYALKQCCSEITLNWSLGACGLALHLGALKYKQALFGDQRLKVTIRSSHVHLSLRARVHRVESPAAFPSDSLRPRLPAGRWGTTCIWRVFGKTDELTEGKSGKHNGQGPSHLARTLPTPPGTQGPPEPLMAQTPSARPGREPALRAPNGEGTLPPPSTQPGRWPTTAIPQK